MLIKRIAVSHGSMLLLFTLFVLAAAWFVPAPGVAVEAAIAHQPIIVPAQTLQSAILPLNKPRVSQPELKFDSRPQQLPPKLTRTMLPGADKLPLNNPQTIPASVSADKRFSSVSADKRFLRQPFFGEIDRAARAASLDPALVHAVIYVESRYRHDAISPKGAIGLMQVLPGTAARYGINDVSLSAKVNLQAGTLYLRDLMRMFDNRIDLVLAAYNAGEGAVMKYARQIPPYRETQLYVLAVMAKYKEWHDMETAMQDAEEEIVAIEYEAMSVALPEPDIKPAELTPTPPLPQVRTEYLEGTRLVLSEAETQHNY